MKFLKVSNIKLSIDEKEQKAFEKAIKIAGIHSDDVIEKKILKYSIDARKKPEINKIYTVLFKVENYNKTRKNVTVTDKEKKYDFAPTGTCSIKKRPIIVGFGPAGMFCGYMLAKYGYKPIIIERGSRVDERIKKVNAFWNGEKLDTSCNVQFGEGGAGTFSDGKLNTGIKDKENRIGFVLNTFVKFGANPKIEYDAKPHIGTDVLSEVVKNMRHAIEDMGGTFYFDTTVSEILLKNGRVNGVKLSNEEVIDTDICLLAIGHSARDTFEMLNRLNIPMEGKPFAMGVRVEHPQKMINKSQYDFEDNRLGAANYKLTYKTKKDRGVYSFCMCPGGFVVNASSEEKEIAVNGMSYSKRDGENANSAIVVALSPKDFRSSHPLAGMWLQRDIEKAAYKQGKGNIPLQTYGDFKKKIKSEKIGKIIPQIKGEYTMADINKVLPDFVCEALVEGIDYFGKVIDGFNNEDTVLSAPESRTSSPVRIIRNDDFESEIKGLYPIGEGAGYAGGITSAAIDGIKAFEALAKKYRPLQ